MQLSIEKLGKVAITIEEDYWSQEKDYDRLTIVEAPNNEYKTYISRKPVPAGTVLTNRKYWLPFSSLTEEIVIDFNAFVTSLTEAMQETKQYTDAVISEGVRDINAIKQEAISIVTYIADNGIDSKVLAPNSVTTEKIADNAVTNKAIAPNAINGDKIVDNSITGDKFIDNTIPGSKLQDGSIQSVDIADNTLSGTKLVDNSISGTKIANNAITANHILDNSVPGEKIADGAIESVDLKDGSLSGSKLKNNSVETAKIANGAVTTEKLADGAITNQKIVDLAVTTAKIANSGITTPNINNGAVTTAKIADGNITTDKINNSAVSEGKLAAGAVNTSKISDNAVTTDKLANGAVTEVKINSSAVTNNKIVDGAITESKLATGAVTTAKLVDANVTTAKIADGAVTTAKINNGAVTTDKIPNNNITTAKIDDGAVTSDKIPDNAIITSKIANLNVTTSKIANGAVTEDKLADGAITTDKIADDAITELQTIMDEVPTAGSVKPVQSGGVQNELALGAVYDVSAKNPTAGPNNDGKFTLEYILNQNNVNTLIPTAVRKGGMSIKFVQSSDNKYVQYRLMSDSFNTTVSNWQALSTFNGYLDGVTDTDLNELTQTGIYRRLKDGNYAQVIVFVTTGYGVVYQTKVLNLDNEFKILSRKKENNVWSEWSEELSKDIVFTGTYTSSTRDSIRDTGLYKVLGASSTLLVTKYSNSNINQVEISPTSEGNISIRNRIYDGSSWSDWENYSSPNTFNDGYITDADLDSLTSIGVYRYNSGRILLVSKVNIGGVDNILQTRISMTITGRIMIKSRTFNGTSWSDWNGGGNVFTDEITDSAVMDTTFETGIYKHSSYGTVYYVTKYADNNVVQCRFGTISSHDISIDYRYYNGSVWSSWVPANKMFNGTISSNTELDNTKSDGSYKGIGDFLGYLFTVKNYETGIVQTRIASSGSTLSSYLQYRVFKDNAWSSWVVSGIRACYSNVSELNNYNSRVYAGLYLNPNNGEICLVRYDSSYGGKTSQMRIFPSTEGKLVRVGRYKPNSGSWTDWTTLSDDDVFNGHFSDQASLNTKVETGVYRGIGDTYMQSILFVKAVDANIYQTRLVVSSSGEFNIESRVSTDSGTTWGSWSNYIGTILSNAGIDNNGLVSKKSDGSLYVNNPKYIPISDTITEKSASDNRFIVDRTTGMMYSMYSTGIDHLPYFEGWGKLVLTIVPMEQPWRTEYITVAETEVTNQGGQSIYTNDTDADGNPITGCVIVGNLLFINKVVDGVSKKFIRCFVSFHTNPSAYYYRDFDIVTKQFDSKLKKVLYNGNALSGNTLNDIVVAAGYSSITPEMVRVTGLIGQADDGNYKYSIFMYSENTPLQYQVVMKSDDNFANVELIGVFPYQVQYETDIIYINGIFYIAYRQADGQYLTTTTDFVTYTEPVKYSDLDARPVLFSHNNQLCIITGYADNASTASNIRFKRTNAKFLIGSGTDVSSYTKLVELYDKDGVCQPVATIFGAGKFLITSYTTSPIGLDEENGMGKRYRGKNCVVFYKVKIKETYD